MEKIELNVPNKLSILRVALVPVFALLFYLQFPYHYLVAAVVFVIAAGTDFLDGYIARKNHIVTDLGKFLDSSADKVLVLTVLVLFLTHDFFPAVIGGIGVSIIVAREIIVSCLRMVAASKGVVMAADIYGKIKTFCQDICIAVMLVAFAFANNFGSILKIVGYVLFGLSVLFTIASGVNYFVKNIGVLKETDGDTNDKA